MKVVLWAGSEYDVHDLCLLFCGETELAIPDALMLDLISGLKKRIMVSEHNNVGVWLVWFRGVASRKGIIRWAFRIKKAKR